MSVQRTTENVTYARAKASIHLIIDYLGLPVVASLFPLFFPPCRCLVSSTQKVKGFTFCLGKDILIPQRLRQLLFEFTQSWSHNSTLQSSVVSSSSIQQGLVFSRVRPEQASLEIDQKRRFRGRSRILSGPQIVNGCDARQKTILKVLGRKGWCSQVTTQDIQLEIEKNNGNVVALDHFVQSFNVGKFLSTRNKNNVQVGILQLSYVSTFSSKKVEKDLVRLEQEMENVRKERVAWMCQQYSRVSLLMES